MRLFVAVWPSAQVVDDLRGLDRPPLPGVRWTTPDQWHVTLRFVGELEDADLLTTRIRQLAPHVQAPGAPTVAETGPRSVCLGPSVLCLPVTGLDALAAAVRTATADLGRPDDRPGFRAHLTLARARRGAARSVLRGLPVIELASRWTVEEVTVVASTLGGTGSAYTVVGRVSLSPG
jgi:RNA 2',3'-cyclic 3'-phosphodiesterase